MELLHVEPYQWPSREATEVANKITSAIMTTSEQDERNGPFLFLSPSLYPLQNGTSVQASINSIEE